MTVQPKVFWYKMAAKRMRTKPGLGVGGAIGAALAVKMFSRQRRSREDVSHQVPTPKILISSPSTAPGSITRSL